LVTKPRTGDKARNFTLEDQNEKLFKLSKLSKLSKLKGKKILLSFHPLAWTSVCAEQMKALETNKKAFDTLNAIAVGISVDTQPSKKAWATSLGIKNTRLLCDFWPHGKVARKYGIFRKKDGVSERANIIITTDQKIAFAKVYPLGQLPDIKEILEKLKNTP
jgi:peroxiredoxin